MNKVVVVVVVVVAVVVVVIGYHCAIIPWLTKHNRQDVAIFVGYGMFIDTLVTLHTRFVRLLAVRFSLVSRSKRLKRSVLDMKLGRERREGLERDETVAREKRNVFSRLALVSFRLAATFCEHACLG